MNADRLGVGSVHAHTHIHASNRTEGGAGRLNGDTLTSHSLLHTYSCYTNIHAYTSTKGWGLESCHNLSHTLAQQSAAVTPTTADLSLFLSPSRFHFPFFLTLETVEFWMDFFWLPSLPPLHLTATWNSLGHSFQWKMLSRSRNVVSGPPIWLVRVGCLPRAQQVQSWNYEPQSR